MRLVTVYLAGLLFGLGIAISGMGNPAKVLNFFDFAGTWDASLIFVMGAALVVTFTGYRLVFRRKTPMFEPRFHLPTARVIDARLVGGAAVFGLGWGLSGFCPGGVLPVISTGNGSVLIFTAAMVAGMGMARVITGALARRNVQAVQPAE